MECAGGTRGDVEFLLLECSGGKALELRAFALLLFVACPLASGELGA